MRSFLPRLVGVGSVKLIRCFHRSSRHNGVLSGSYEGEGKTTVTVLNRDSNYGLMVDGISSAGFKLNNGIWILGPTIIFPRSVMGWNISSSDEINDNSLALFKILDPSLDMLIVGLDQNYGRTAPFIDTLRSFAKKLKTNIEILPVEHACTTFNFMNAERRYVAAALMPPRIQLPKGLKSIQDIAIRHQLAKAEQNMISE